ncbi:hypothetical protein C815_01166 [Firmicutes bacterium M10-2]|nr:hypothetical protein C815_01166 [Firmicutes bacterium M10-2]
MSNQYKRNFSLQRQQFTSPQPIYQESTEDSDEVTIDLRELWTTLKKHLGMLILLTVICATLGGLGTKFLIPKTYASSASIFFTPMVSESGYVDVNSMNSNEKLVNNVMTLIKQNNIMSQVAKDTGLGSTKEAADAITVTNTTNTTLVTITAVTEDAKLSKDIVSSAVNTFIEQMKDTLNVRNIEIVDQPKLSYVPVGPHVKRNALIGAVLGFGIGCAYIVLKVVLDKRLKNKEEAEKYLGIPVLCQLPDLDA